MYLLIRFLSFFLSLSIPIKQWFSFIRSVFYKYVNVKSSKCTALTIKINLCEWPNSATDISDLEKAYSYLHILSFSHFLALCFLCSLYAIIQTPGLLYQLFQRTKCSMSKNVSSVHFIVEIQMGNIKHLNTSIPRVS